MYQKFGHYKFKDQCKRTHLEEVCSSLGACENLKFCQKRHPMVCKRFAIEKFCRFGKSCSYHHTEDTKLENKIDIDEMKNKLKEMEKTICGMS